MNHERASSAIQQPRVWERPAGIRLSRLFHRSVAGQVARRAEMPVLICRSDVVGIAE